jgi:hypothetical protein
VVNASNIDKDWGCFQGRHAGRHTAGDNIQYRLYRRGRLRTLCAECRS